jgi:hypothetical protein
MIDISPKELALDWCEKYMELARLVNDITKEVPPTPYQKFYQHGIDAVLSIVAGPMSLKESMTNAERLIADAAERAMRLVLIRLD